MNYDAELDRLDRELYPEKYAGAEDTSRWTRRGRPPKRLGDEKPDEMVSTSVWLTRAARESWRQLAERRKETMGDTLVEALRRLAMAVTDGRA